jgi:hypothetical protein
MTSAHYPNEITVPNTNKLPLIVTRDNGGFVEYINSIPKKEF